MTTVVRKNERSWAIELICAINAITQANDLLIRRAGGESTLSTGRGNTMFPDVILYGDQAQSVILQGWELKMPDVPIEDEAFLKDAQRKAAALGLNSCLIWNFTYAVLYVRQEDGCFVKLKQWDETRHIRTREDVETYRADWERLLEVLLLDINSYFVSGRFRNAPLEAVISQSTITRLILRNKAIVAGQLKDAAFRDSVLAAYIEHWWAGIRAEYEHDETDPFQAYAKSVILNWANRITFAHLIKSRHNGARAIDELDETTTPGQANALFQRITARCDFHHIFSPARYDESLPALTWRDLVEYAGFLKDSGVERLSQESLQNILEGSVATGKREVNGQYATPPALARLLLRLTVRDWSDSILDCCCGTGTIPKAAIQIKKTHLSAQQAVESVWACDKYQYPLQLANISMTDADTIHLANRLFQHNALTLSVGEEISIVDPETGERRALPLPAFGAVVSNLPFVPFEIIPEDDRALLAEMPLAAELDGRSDLYCYIAAKLADVMKPGGRLGLIVSNSWLGTRAGGALMKRLRQRYHLRQVHLSGRGRWFQNADVVTTLLVLEKKGGDEGDAATDFWLWKRSLEHLAESPGEADKLVHSALLGEQLDPAVSRLSRYTPGQIDELLSLNVSYNALFHDIDWLLTVRDRMVPIQTVYRVFRGSRRGWDPLFYPRAGEHRIEPQYLKKVLLNAKGVHHLTASADRDAFCCGLSPEQLRERGHTGALEWISRFAQQKNGVGRPLPQVLQQKGMQWYELKQREAAEVFTMMNPDQRLFFARFDTPSFINQRLIGLTRRAAYPDTALNHALLNSMFTMFYMEASGFGRGLGVLDIKKQSIAQCRMLDPKRVSPQDRAQILAAFERLMARPIGTVTQELEDPLRLAFERAVFQSFGIQELFGLIKDSLLRLQETRAAVRR